MSRFALCAMTALTASIAAAAPALAGPDDFGPGPVIPEFGPIADVPGAHPVPVDHIYRVSFDTSQRAGESELNSTLTGAARFLNMHVAAGVPAENIHLAVVFHGSAVRDVTTAEAGANAGLVAALVENGVQILVCGQSAVWYETTAADFLPGVEMSLSAMTAHALLQSEGYTLNPF
jgi:intracellular sulfur oxidation DsrE/DsrF family protein